MRSSERAAVLPTMRCLILPRASAPMTTRLASLAIAYDGRTSSARPGSICVRFGSRSHCSTRASSAWRCSFRIFGDVYASSRQPLKLRQLATISGLAVLGSAAPQLRFHIGAGRHVGLSEAQLVEVIAWVQFFAGAPAAYNALIELKTSLAEGSDATPAYQ